MIKTTTFTLVLALFPLPLAAQVKLHSPLHAGVQASEPTCSAGQFSIYPFSTNWKKCENGVSSLLSSDVVNVKAYGAVGDGATDNVTAFSSAFTAACAISYGRTVFIPDGNYLLGSTYDIPCDHLRVTGEYQTRITYSGTGPMWTSSIAGNLLKFDNFRAYGAAISGTWFFKMIGSGGLGVANSTFDNLRIEGFGDVATQTGGGIWIAVDSAKTVITNSIINVAGYAVQFTAPSDTSDVSHNYLTSTTGWCVSYSSGSGATAMSIHHNNMTCRTGAGIINPGAGVGMDIYQNEYESTGVIVGTNTRKTVWDIISGTIKFFDNKTNGQSNFDYTAYAADAVVNGWFTGNEGYNYDVNSIKIGTGTGNLYAFNRGDSAATLYSDSAYQGIIDIQASGHPAFNKLDINVPAGLTTITGTSVQGLRLSSDAIDSWAGVDFSYSGNSLPLGRFACVPKTAGSNCGIGVSNNYANGITTVPLTLTYNGDAQIARLLQLSAPEGTPTTVSQPTCTSTLAGAVHYSGHTTDVKDTVSVCASDATNTFAWRTIY